MHIIDCHVHTQAVVNYHEAALRLLEHMDNHGISSMIVSDLGDNWKPFPDSKTIHIANLRLKEFSLVNQEKVHYLVYINPLLSDWIEEFNSHKDTAVGVKLWISLRQENDFSLDKSIEVLKMAAKYDLPVLIHVFETTDPLLFGSIGIDGIIELATKVPNCTIIAAHSCGSWRRTIKRCHEFPNNIYFDISGSYPERTMVSSLVSCFGADRILYGSDAPGRSFGSQLHKVIDGQLTFSQQEKILYKNAKKIFKLKDDLLNNKNKKLPQKKLANLGVDNFCFVGNCPWFDHNVTVDDLVIKLKENEVNTAYVANLDAITASNKLAANKLFRKATLKYKEICPLAVVDLNNIEEAYKQIEEINNFAGIWISPYLHNYQLNFDLYKDFFLKCSQLGINIFINVALSDDRFRYSQLKTTIIKEQDIIEFAKKAPKNKYVIQGARNHEQLSLLLPENFFLEYSKLSDGEYAAEDFTGNVQRLCRGTEYPFRSYSCVDDVLLGKV